MLAVKEHDLLKKRMPSTSFSYAGAIKTKGIADSSRVSHTLSHLRLFLTFNICRPKIIQLHLIYGTVPLRTD